jgi:hypothetical protein
VATKKKLHKIKKEVMMKALFLGGDKRQLEIINDFILKNIDTYLIGYENISIDKATKLDINSLNIADYDLIFFPINGVKDDFSITCSYDSNPIYLGEKLLVDTKENVKIFLKENPTLRDELEQKIREHYGFIEKKKEKKEKDSEK